MLNFISSLRSLFTRRYVHLLEDECARLRAENRALLNSLLGTAGIAPLDAVRPAGPPLAPVRRRSWPQIAAELEQIAAGKKTMPSDLRAVRTMQL